MNAHHNPQTIYNNSFITKTSSKFEMATKSKILIIGGTGHIGKCMVEASVRARHPTFALIRESTVVFKANLINKFRNLGVNIITGDLSEHATLVKAIKQVDVVISTVGVTAVRDQIKIIAAIKEAGNVKRFFPSEFGLDVGRFIPAVEPAKTACAMKAEIRRAVEAERIPFTYVSSNFFTGYFLSTLSQHRARSLWAPPTDEVMVFGSGTSKAVFTMEEDIATYTIRAVDDPRTLNKILYIRPPANTLSFNELVSMWEKRIGKTLERVYVSEEQVLKIIQETEFPGNMFLAINHAVYVNGVPTNFDIDPTFGVEATQLYADVKYTTVNDYLGLCASQCNCFPYQYKL